MSSNREFFRNAPQELDVPNTQGVGHFPTNRRLTLVPFICIVFKKELHMATNPPSLPDVAETGLLTFYCHVIENQSAHPILQDEKAVEVSRQLNPLLAESSNPWLRRLAKGKVKDELVVHITLRAKKYDEYATAFFKGTPGRHPGQYRLRDGLALFSESTMAG